MTVIKLKKSETALSKPTTSDIVVGEVAINALDQRIFVRDSNDDIITIGEAGGKRHENATIVFKVTVATKDNKHRYNGSGSSNGYKIDGSFSPTLELIPGNTYKFDQSDSSNSSHPLAFYYDSGKNTSYSTGVTTNGTAGSSGAYTQIVVSDTTPTVLHYQCTAHGLMGNQVVVATRNLTGFNTGDLPEGANLYYTNARVDSQVNTHLNQSSAGTSQVLSWNGSDYAWVNQSSGGSSSFTGLSDTPSSLSGQGNKFVKVIANGSSLEFVSDPGYITSITSSDIGANIIDNTHIDFGTTGNKVNTGDLPEGTNLYYTDARVDSHLNQSNPTSGYVLSWNGSDYAWVAQSSGGGSQNVFSTIAVTGTSGQSNVVADSTTDTLTLNAGTNMTITTNATGDTITFASAGGGGSTALGDLTDVSTTGAATGQVLTTLANGSFAFQATAADDSFINAIIFG